MKTLPNRLTIFNATPHTIRFWREDWDAPVEVETNVIVSARPFENPACVPPGIDKARAFGAEFVSTSFVGTPEGEDVILQAYDDGADLVIGSIIAAQAYPGLVMAMTPAPGYERVPPAEKRMNPDKFTVF